MFYTQTHTKRNTSKDLQKDVGSLFRLVNKETVVHFFGIKTPLIHISCYIVNQIIYALDYVIYIYIYIYNIIIIIITGFISYFVWINAYTYSVA